MKIISYHKWIYSAATTIT